MYICERGHLPPFTTHSDQMFCTTFELTEDLIRTKRFWFHWREKKMVVIYFGHAQ
jgi:hypothetical protein